MPPSDSYFPPDISQPDPEDLPERRQSHIAWRAEVNKRLDDGAATMEQLKADLHANTVATNESKQVSDAVKQDTAELIGIFKSFQGAMTVLDMLGRLAKPLTYITMLGTALWGVISLFKSGGSPPR